MQATQINHPYAPTTGGRTPNKILNILSWYPFMWTAGILIYALVKSHVLIMAIMITWVIFLYFGSLTWLGLLIFLTVKKKITIKQTLLHVAILAIGTLVAYYVCEYDILSSGVKYMD